MYWKAQYDDVYFTWLEDNRFLGITTDHELAELLSHRIRHDE